MQKFWEKKTKETLKLIKKINKNNFIYFSKFMQFLVLWRWKSGAVAGSYITYYLTNIKIQTRKCNNFFLIKKLEQFDPRHDDDVVYITSLSFNVSTKFIQDFIYLYLSYLSRKIQFHFNFVVFLWKSVILLQNPKSLGQNKKNSFESGILCEG